MASVYKRGETYYARFTYRGKEFRRSLDTTSQRIANDRLLSFIAQVQAGKWRDGKRHKFGDAIDRYIDAHFANLRPNSRKRYAVHLINLRAHLNVEFIDEIDSATLGDFEIARRKEGVTNSTIRRDLMCLSSLCTWAKSWHWLNSNPAAEYLQAARKRGMTEAEPRDRFLSHAEEACLFDHVTEMRKTVKGNRDIHGWQMQEAVFTFAIDTGLRAEEIFSLTWPQVNLDAREVKVVKEKAKGKRSRSVPIFPRSVDMLTRLPRSKHSKYVFWHRDGKRYRSMYVQLMRICEKIGIEDFEFHDLRRTCGVRLLRDHGLSIERVSLWLGHNNINITEKVYAFLSVDDLHKAVANSPMTKNVVAQYSAQC